MQKINPRVKRISLRIALTALFIAFAACCKLFTLNIPLFGASGMRVGLGGVFTTFPAILFGPLYGGMASAASDVIGWFVSPTDAYNPLFTLTALAGGIVKGLIWWALKKSNPKALRIGFTSCFALLLAAGLTFYGCLAAAGITFGAVAQAEEMPEYGNASVGNPVSRLVLRRAAGTGNTYTFTAFPDGEKIVVPSKIHVGGENGYYPKLSVGKNALKNTSAKEIYLPDKLSSFSADLKDTGITVCMTDKCSVKDKIIEAGYAYRIIESQEELVIEAGYGETESGGYAFTTNDKYRKSLAGYVNFATFGITLVGILGILAAVGETLITRMRIRKGKEPTHAPRIFAAIFAAELVQTTINTVILKELTMAASWASYPFAVVFLPRLAEGLIVCIIQAYFITLLYAFLSKRATSTGLITE